MSNIPQPPPVFFAPHRDDCGGFALKALTYSFSSHIFHPQLARCMRRGAWWLKVPQPRGYWPLALGPYLGPPNKIDKRLSTTLVGFYFSIFFGVAVWISGDDAQYAYRPKWMLLIADIVMTIMPSHILDAYFNINGYYDGTYPTNSGDMMG